jgi:hypothetical protein
MNLSELLDLHKTGSNALRPFRGALRLLRPARLDRDAARNYDALVKQNPLIPRFPRNEQERMRGEERTNIESDRRTAGSRARHQAREARSVVARGRNAIACARRDVTASMPACLNHVTADGMIGLATLRAMLLPLLRQAGPSELLGVYQSAIQRQDARGFVEAEIIEGLVAMGATALPADEVERGVAKQLREFVDDVQTERLPIETPDFDELEREADRLDALADAIGLSSVDPEQLSPPTAEVVAQVYERLSAELDAAAEASDVDDLETVRKEAASA